MLRIYVPEDVYYQRPEGPVSLLGYQREIAGTRIAYIVWTRPENKRAILTGLDYLGRVSVDGRKRLSSGECLHFTFENHLVLHRTEQDGGSDSHQIILYNPKTFAHLVDADYKESDLNSELMVLARDLDGFNQRMSNSWFRSLARRSTQKTVDAIARMLTFVSFVLMPLNWTFKNTAVAQHFREWRIIFNGGGTGSRSSIKKLLPIAIDVLLGLCIMFIIGRNTNPAEYLMTVTHETIVYLRKLLEGLRGSPVGLKVNLQLNDFLLNCFIYQINLWKTFLSIVSPAISYLFAILSIFGMCGFSFQLAMLSDLFVLITIHAHCFYIYAAVLYRLEIVGLKALWRIVLGRRKNVLKNRVESYDYEHSQLFMATLFFSSLLFLLPTVIVYYVVFSTVRLGIYCIIFTLLIIRRKILQMPVYQLVRYLAGIHISPANVVMEIVEDEPTSEDAREPPEQQKVTVVRIKPQRAAIKWGNVPKEAFDNDYPSIGQFFADVLRGEIKGFIRPRSKNE